MSFRPSSAVPIRLRLKSGWERFIHWWLAELARLLPASWRAGRGDMTDHLLFAFADDACSVRRWQGDRWVEASRRSVQGLDVLAQMQAVHALLKLAGGGPDAPLALALPPRQVLRKELQLPLAVEENLRTVLQYEIDHYTPFRSDQVYFDYRVLQRDLGLGKIKVLLGVVPRPVVDDEVARLQRWNLAAQAAVVIDDLRPQAPALDFLPAEVRPKHKLGISRRNLLLAALVALLGLTALALPIVVKRQASIALIPIVEQADRATRFVERQRDRVQAEQARYNLLIQKKREHPSVILLLDELTRLLPPDTWVQQLSLNGNNLQIQGDTGSSSKLIGLVENSHILRGANFMAPLTKAPNGNTEHYQLGAEVEPAPLSMLANAPQRTPARPAAKATPPSRPASAAAKAAAPARLASAASAAAKAASAPAAAASHAAPSAGQKKP
jgi:general secretion pathway protein L